MLATRLIATLIVADGTVVQSVQFKHTNVIHWKPLTAIDFFNKWEVDEIVLLDVSRVNTRESREKFHALLSEMSEKCFVPLTVGGWIKSAEDVRTLLRLGADKVVLNTEAYRRPMLIREVAAVFGSQCVVVSIDVRGGETVYINRGATRVFPSPVDRARQAESDGAGEIYITSIDHDGMRQGYDLDLVRSIVHAVNIPVVAFGGVFTWQHLVDGVLIGGADAVAAANAFHFTEHSTKRAKDYMRKAGIAVR